MADNHNLIPSTEYRLLLEDIDFRLLIQNLDNVHLKVDNNDLTLHSHEFSELFVCVSGSISLMTQTGQLQLNAGEAAVVLPGILHRKLNSSKQAEWYTVCFSGAHRSTRDGGGLYRKLRMFFEGECVLIVRDTPELATDIRCIDRNFHRQNTIQPPLLLASLLLKMSDYGTKTQIQIPTERVLIPGEIHRLIRMDEIIERHFMEDWSASKIANVLHLSSRQIDRIAQKRYGKTFRQALIDKRCKIALHYLLTTDMTAAEIANASGFNSVKSMYREFKQQYSMAPMEYKKHLTETMRLFSP